MSDTTTLPYAGPATDATSTRHPRAFWFFFWGEFAERCSYYGMRAILPLYLTASMHFAATKAGPIYYWFKMACYFLPLLGGYLADRVFGKYWTIVGFSIPYVLGHFILGIGTETALFIGLALLAGGSGVIKPNISTLMGQTYDQQRPGQEQLRATAFLWFYFSINMGALISTIGVPIIRNHHGYRTAFHFPRGSWSRR
jgi:amino acid/peptide:H+ symporter